MLGVGTAGLHQAVERILTLERVLVTRRFNDQFLAATVHQLERGENLRELALGSEVSLLDLLKALKTKVSHINGLGARGTLDRDSGYEANGTLRADEQLLEIVTSVVLA